MTRGIVHGITFYFKKVILHGFMYINVSTMCFSKIFFCQELNAKVNKVTSLIF